MQNDMCLCLFVWFDSLHPINNLSVKQGLVFLGWTSTKLGYMGARQFVENYFVDTTIGRIWLLVNATFLKVRHFVEKISQVRHSVEIVNHFFD